MNTGKFDFLFSVRFWNLFLVGVATGLTIPLPNNLWVRGLAVAITVWFGGSTIVRTIDRLGEPKTPPALAEEASKQP